MTVTGDSHPDYTTRKSTFSTTNLQKKRTWMSLGTCPFSIHVVKY